MNQLSIDIVFPSSLEQDVKSDRFTIYDEGLDNVTSVFSDVCEIIAKHEGIEFMVSGFGQDRWPLDIATDLLCAVEELGEIVHGLGLENYDFEFDLYEQGVERLLKFSSFNDQVRVKCFSNTDWVPEPTSILMDKREVKRMFFSLKHTFCLLAVEICPKVSSHKWFKDWAESE